MIPYLDRVAKDAVLELLEPNPIVVLVHQKNYLGIEVTGGLSRALTPDTEADNESKTKSVETTCGAARHTRCCVLCALVEELEHEKLGAGRMVQAALEITDL